jgi:hypothetical protein
LVPSGGVPEQRDREPEQEVAVTPTEPLEPEGTSGSTGSPGGSKSKAWLLVLGGLIAVLAVVLAIVLITRDDDSDSAATTTTTEPPTTTTEPPTTTSPTTTVAPPPSTLPLPPITDDPQSYAEYLFVAWQNADQTAAANVADPGAVGQIFARPYSAASQWVFQTCDPAAGSLYCTWNGANNAQLLMTVRTLTGGLPVRVVMVQFQTA